MAFLSVRIKILLSLILITVLFGLGMVVFAETVIYHKLHDKLKDKGVAITKRVAIDCVTPIITERYFEISMMLKDLMNSERDIVYAYVLNESGRDIAHTFEKGVPEKLKHAHEADIQKQFSAKDLQTDKGRVHDIAVPLLRGHVGVLHLGFSDIAISKDIDDIIKAILLYSLAVLAVGIAASFGFSRVITRPLLKLSQAAEAFGRGEVGNRIVINSDDEVGELARIFNSMIERRRQADAEKERLIRELREAMANVKTLRGLLPICSSCKKIRDDRGYWNQIESYVHEHTDAEFSHGICPDCSQKLYPELWNKMQNKKSDRQIEKDGHDAP